MKCPYCGDEIGQQKRHCEKPVPARYIQKYDLAPPFFGQIIGWSGVGKTVYMQSLTLSLLKLGAFLGENYSYAPLTEATLSFVQNARSFQNGGSMPDATQLKLQDPYVIQLLGFGPLNGKTIIFRDVAGEAFETFAFRHELVPYLTKIVNTIIMFSIPDMEKKHKQMDDFLNCYIETNLSLQPNFFTKQRNVIIVLSKADLFIEQIPEHLQSYLLSDPFSHSEDPEFKRNFLDQGGMKSYIKNLPLVSKEICNWLLANNYPGVSNLLALAKSNNIRIEFSLISSTGRPVDSNKKMEVAIAPTRVIDPLLWTLII